MNGKTSGVSSRLAVLFAVSAGLAVGNLYWAQPLLAAIAESFGLEAAQGGFLVTATQIGYALGILLIVPLGDVLDRRKLLGLVMLMTIAALALCAFAPSVTLLALALAVLGLFTVSGQIILPMAGDLATDNDRGRIVGLVASGITAGILFSRLLSGLVADFAGWRGIYILAAALNLVMVIAIHLWLPQLPKREKISYQSLLKSVFTSIKRYPAMRAILLKQGMVFGITFNLFWTALTFLLSGEPFSYGTTEIGFVSLAGLTGAIAGAKLGTLQDRGLGHKGITVFIGMNIISMALAAVLGFSIVAIVLVAAVFSLGVQGVGVLVQAQLFSLSSSERSRLNTAFVVSNFLFSAVGSSLASFLWNMGGWQTAALGGVCASLVALAVHLFGTSKNNSAAISIKSLA